MADKAEVEAILGAIREDIHELKESHKEWITLMRRYAVLEEKLMASNEKHNEGRKVISKRIDLIVKVAFVLGGGIFSTLIYIIKFLLEKGYGG